MSHRLLSATFATLAMLASATGWAVAVERYQSLPAAKIIIVFRPDSFDRFIEITNKFGDLNGFYVATRQVSPAPFSSLIQLTRDDLTILGLNKTEGEQEHLEFALGFYPASSSGVPRELRAIAVAKTFSGFLADMPGLVSLVQE